MVTDSTRSRYTFDLQQVETHMFSPKIPESKMLSDIDPVFVGLVAVLLGFFFFGYLLVRRTLIGLREGYNDGRK